MDAYVVGSQMFDVRSVLHCFSLDVIGVIVVEDKNVFHPLTGSYGETAGEISRDVATDLNDFQIYIVGSLWLC